MEKELNQWDFEAALDYVLDFADYERVSRSAVVFDLARIEALLKRLGNPHLAAKSVHIAGTKGKGSTSAMIASALTRSGYQTGLYTSPHLLSIRERIQTDGSPISEVKFARLVENLKPDIEEINRSGGLGELTTYEILTAITFVYFKEMGMDFQVMEVGLGGRLDATNVVKPEVCVITSISFDHMEVLGNTLAEIAAEKAGIIKPGSTVVSAPQAPEASEVIEKISRERGARLIRVGHEVTWQRTDFDLYGQSFKLTGLNGEYDLAIPLLGEHQLDNAAVAVAALEVLTGPGTKISPDSIARGLAQVYWPGRLQVLDGMPLFILDGAHNADSVMKLGKALKQYFTFDKIFLIAGVSQDKEIAGIVAELSAISSNIIVTAANHPRALDIFKLAAEFSKHGTKPQIISDVKSAMALALFQANQNNDLICATGSLFVVSEVMEHLKRPSTQLTHPVHDME